MSKHIFSLASVLLIGFYTNAQNAQLDKPHNINYGTAILVNTALQNEPHLIYNMTFTYADSTIGNPFTVNEQVNMDVKMSNGKMYYAADSIIEIEGFHKHVSISLADSVIILTPKKDYTSFFQVAFMDSVFQQANVDSATTIENFADSTGQITFFFKPNSYYKGYSIKYSLKNSIKFLPLQFVMTYISDESINSYGRLAIDFSEYTRNPAMNKNVFNELQYVTLTIGGYIANAPFTGFNVIDLTENPVLPPQ